MRILWIANAPWTPSAYSQQSTSVVRRLIADGHEVIYAANYGLAATEIDWQGVRVLPHNIASYGTDALPMWLRRCEPDMVVMLQDLWALPADSWQLVRASSDARFVAWTPLDKWPLSPDDREGLVRIGFEPVPMSAFGAQLLDAAGLPRHRVIWHGIEPDVWRVPDAARRSETRAKLGVPDDAFLVSVVGMNKEPGPVPRKAFPAMLTAFRAFAENHDDAFMSLWCVPGTTHGGLDLFEIAESVGVPDERLLFSPMSAHWLGASPSMMADYLGCADVLLQTSMGEGFGVPLIEAAACGVPTIATGATAQPELLDALAAASVDADAGLGEVFVGRLVSGEPIWHPDRRAWSLLPHVDSIAAGLEAARSNALSHIDRRRLSLAAHQTFSHDVLFDGWREVIDAEPRCASAVDVAASAEFGSSPPADV